MKATQKVTKYSYHIPKNAEPEAYQMISNMLNKMNEISNSPLPSDTNPKNYTRKIVVKSSMRNKNPNGIFRLFTSGDNLYDNSKNMFRLFKR